MCHFYERGDAAINKGKCQCLIRTTVPVPAQASEGSHAQELTGSSNCKRTQPLHTRLTPAITSALKQRRSCLAFAAVPKCNLLRDNICIWWQFEWINMKLQVQHYQVSVSKYLSPWRHFVLVITKKRERSLFCSYICENGVYFKRQRRRKDEPTDVSWYCGSLFWLGCGYKIQRCLLKVSIHSQKRLQSLCLSTRD